jgi:hypothetical protein
MAATAVFEAWPLLVGPKFGVTSVAVLQTTLYVGCDDGALRVYEITDGESSRRDTGISEPPAQHLT